MKIRIKGHAIRFRLSKTEVAQLCKEGEVIAETKFGSGLPAFFYALKSSNQVERMKANFEQNTITIFVAKTLLENWEENETVGFEFVQQNDTEENLHLLVEKDFQCTIERPNENEADLYENPHMKKG